MTRNCQAFKNHYQKCLIKKKKNLIPFPIEIITNIGVITILHIKINVE